MTKPDIDAVRPQRSKMKLWYNIGPLAFFAFAYFLLGIELAVHLGISNNELIIEYLPKFTAAAATSVGFMMLSAVIYWSVIFRRASPYKPGKWFWIAIILVPILAGFGEYATIQYRLNTNGYERCYSVDVDGKRIEKPFYERLMERQKWLLTEKCYRGR